MQKVIFSSLFLLVISSCSSSKICNKHSEWRDNNGPDKCSFYSESESCEKIIGRLMIRSRLHKNLFEPGIFEGGMSSRWFDIKTDSIFYYAPKGNISDKGRCYCSNGILKVEWEIGQGLPKEATIYFNDAQSAEFRYYDYPYSFDTFQYDTTKSATNPTKIMGQIVPN
jgi:hypothetical protein